jgi:tetratricopeptide (TPR) repeat protein
LERPIEDHLNSAELDWLVSSTVERMGEASPPPDPAAVRLHIERCEQCRESLRGMERTVDRLNEVHRKESRSPSPECPPETVWPDVVVGQGDPAAAEAHLAHTAGCAYCAGRLREASEDLLPEFTAEERQAVGALPSSTEEGQRELKERLAKVSSFDRRVVGFPGGARSQAPAFRWWAAAAAIFLVAIGVGWFTYSRHLSSPDVLLAAAYSERRTVEFRMPGDSYGPLRIQRGANRFGAPALLAAQARIARELSEDPGNAIWIEASARTALLDWRYGEALDLAERLLKARPDWRPALLDSGEAYFERAETEGSAADYQAAIKQFSAVLAAAPDDPIALFNRALAYTKVSSSNEARTDWEHYLRVDSISKWAEEARHRRDATRHP